MSLRQSQSGSGGELYRTAPTHQRQMGRQPLLALALAGTDHLV
ncbi:Hypothetical protein EfmE4452_1419 [Enterococcus faecium E4452]|nr:Hypothetical protein EfmE4452_1419 [Enterococcus faecium E4452]